MQLSDLSDEELVCSLAALCLEGQRLTARVIVHLIEIEERRLDLKAACTSLFDYCVRRMGMSAGAAFRRITAARLVKRHPSLLERIERGELHLSTLVLLRPHLTEANVEELAAAAAGKTQHEVEELLVRLAPRPDVPSAIVELPLPVSSHGASPASPPAPARSRGRIEPLSEARYAVQLTASSTLRDKLERARDLMRHRNPSGDLAVVVERALDVLLEKLEKERLGGTTRPPPRAPRQVTTKPGRIPRPVRREVFERDGERCTFVGEGRRCPSRTLLELDHIESRALGGPDDASNLRVRCRVHNRLHAEQVFGKDHVARQVDFRQRKSRRVITEERVPTTSAPPAPAVIDLAMRGLVNMGFAKPEVSRALDHVSRRRADAGALPVQEILREAIAALT